MSTTRFFSRDTLIGWTVYALGDLLGQWILGEFNLLRTLTIMAVGGLVYRYEVPPWFDFLENHNFLENHPFRPQQWLRPLLTSEGKLNGWGKSLGTILLFNPLWLARHMLVIELSLHPERLQDFGNLLGFCLSLGWSTFLLNLPIALVCNYYLQTRCPVPYRFLVSTLLSAAFTVGYALAHKYL